VNDILWLSVKIYSTAGILVNKKLFVIGGTGFPFAEVRSNVLYCFDLAILHWSVAPCKGTLPGKVYGHVSVNSGDVIG